MRCVKCGGTGYMADGSPCDCKTEVAPVIDFQTNNFIPKRYLGVSLSEVLIKPVTRDYPKDLIDLQKEILSIDRIFINQFIYAPAQSSKSIFVYSTLQKLNERGVDIYPYLDIDELRRVMFDIDNGDKPVYLRKYDVEPFILYETPVLFVKAPLRPVQATFETLATIIDRRVRRGLGTIIISNTPWKVFTFNDQFNYVRVLCGNGTYNSIKVVEYSGEKRLDIKQ